LALDERDGAAASRFARDALALHERLQYARGIELATSVLEAARAA
jgi:hypothetical protein